ncbi:Hsp20/alpha crystallin family protein [Arthrobacter sp. SX1312]|uniref:Hsp20/alpha crystallin family protein n=1 Tax=Arthrobacter sp. SX1312 TaxID=2058896 RepID=UPI000CE381AC|nr:Hsp20/alpha crystallin family protein [Arthrobacter sp. SX1312]
MTDARRWPPFGSSRRNFPFNAGTRSPMDLLDSMERLFESSSSGPASIRVEEFVDGTDMVVRAEMPGLDPDQDIEVSIENGFLRIRAQREENEEHKDKDRYRSEFRYGSFRRDIVLPDGVKDEDIRATYADGVLDVRTPLPDSTKREGPRKLPITRA